MKKLFMLIFVFILFGCSSAKNLNTNFDEISGVYFFPSNKLFQALSDKNYSKIVFKKDGSYELYKAMILFTPIIEQCDIASKGKWSVVADNVIEITSEDYYSDQQGFKYDIKKENKLSQDSLYIQVIFPTDFHPVNLNLTFNNTNSKSIKTEKTSISVPKSKHLWDRKTSTNLISFSVNANVSGTLLYKSRVLFRIFEEYIDTEKYNHLTITLPNFDQCFFEFEPYYKELIFIKGESQILWQGDIWRK